MIQVRGWLGLNLAATWASKILRTTPTSLETALRCNRNGLWDAEDAVLFAVRTATPAAALAREVTHKTPLKGADLSWVTLPLVTLVRVHPGGRATTRFLEGFLEGFLKASAS